MKKSYIILGVILLIGLFVFIPCGMACPEGYTDECCKAYDELVEAKKVWDSCMAAGSALLAKKRMEGDSPTSGELFYEDYCSRNYGQDYRDADDRFTRLCVAVAITDSDGDGVPDDVDACPGTPAGVAVDDKGCPKVMEMDVISPKYNDIYSPGQDILVEGSVYNKEGRHPIEDVKIKTYLYVEGSEGWELELNPTNPEGYYIGPFSLTGIPQGIYTLRVTASKTGYPDVSKTIKNITIGGVTVACYSDSDCDDGNSCTTDTCNNPGTSSASCSHTQITSCIDNDGCCPAGCNVNTDNDCETPVKKTQSEILKEIHEITKKSIEGAKEKAKALKDSPTASEFLDEELKRIDKGIEEMESGIKDLEKYTEDVKQKVLIEELKVENEKLKMELRLTKSIKDMYSDRYATSVIEAQMKEGIIKTKDNEMKTMRLSDGKSILKMILYEDTECEIEALLEDSLWVMVKKGVVGWFKDITGTDTPDIDWEGADVGLSMGDFFDPFHIVDPFHLVLYTDNAEVTSDHTKFETSYDPTSKIATVTVFEDYVTVKSLKTNDPEMIVSAGQRVEITDDGFSPKLELTQDDLMCLADRYTVAFGGINPLGALKISDLRGFLNTDNDCNLYVADWGDNQVKMINPDGSTTTYASGIDRPRYQVFDSAGNLYVGSFDGNIYNVSASGVKTVIASGIWSPQGMGFDSAGNLYVAGSYDGKIHRIAPDGSKTTMDSGFTNPKHLVVYSDGNIYVVDSSGTLIVRITPEGGKTSLVDLGETISGMATDGEYLYVSHADKISRIDTSGQVTQIATDLDQPTHLTVCNGSVFVTVSDGIVKLQISPVSGALKISNLQPGPEDGKDVHVYSYTYRNWDNANWGAYPVLAVSYKGIHLGVDCIDRIYIEFDLSSLPSDREIANATLSLYCYNQEGEGAEYAVYRVTEPWAEGEGTYHSGEVEPTAPEPWITWNRQPSFDSTQAYATEFIAQGSAPRWINLDVTELVENWYDGSWPNYGIVLRLVEENGSVKVPYFYSSESEEAELRPKLVVTFSGGEQPAPTPTPTSTPTPSPTPATPGQTVTGGEYECPQDAGEAYQWYIAAYNKLTSLIAKGEGDLDSPATLQAYEEYKAAKACYESRASGTEPSPTPTPTPTPSPTPAGHKLVAYYPFDGDTKDHSWNGNDGTNHGATFVSGVSGNALKLDGKDDYISTNYTQNSVTAYTIEVWVKTTDSGNKKTFVQDRGSGAGKSLTLGMGQSGGGFGSSGQVFYILESNYIDTGVHSIQTINDNNWHHVVGVWSASPETEIDPSQFKIYIDGVQVTTTSGNYDSSSHPKSPLTGLGGTKIARHDAWNTNFNGIIDEVKIYNYALTASEIKANYNKIKVSTSLPDVYSPKSQYGQIDPNGEITITTFHTSPKGVNNIAYTSILVKDEKNKIYIQDPYILLRMYNLELLCQYAS